MYKECWSRQDNSYLSCVPEVAGCQRSEGGGVVPELVKVDGEAREGGGGRGGVFDDYNTLNIGLPCNTITTMGFSHIPL
jgi:hypothetical protein